MRVGILTDQVPFVRGGAEAHAESLCLAFRKEGYEAELIPVPFCWYPPELMADQIAACKLLDIAESCGVSIDLIIGLKFPAYLVPHPNKVLWILHQHRSAYDLWDKPHGDLHPHPRGREAAALIRSADGELFPQVRKIYSNSKNVARRLQEFCGVNSEPLYHPPPNADRYRWLEDGAFFLVPGRINMLKRQDLVIKALKLSDQRIKVIFIGQLEDRKYFELACLNGGELETGRVQWLGQVSEGEKLTLYGSCLGVIAPPVDEDYGYVTLEAMLSSKPVITCSDSGGTLEFVVDGETGVVCSPEAGDLALAMDDLWHNRGRAHRLGCSAKERYESLELRWDRVIASLVS